MAFNMAQMTEQGLMFMKSAPMPVRMAGFESDTLRMHSAGWMMSMEMRRHMYVDAMDIQVAFRHDGIKQVAMGVMRVDRFSLPKQERMGPFVPFSLERGIDINYMAPMIRCITIPMARGSGLSDWQAIDPRPEISVEKDLMNIAMFKPIKAGEDFEIYIHQKDEKEILDLLLKKQDVRQKEIKQNQKRRAYMEGNAGKEGDMMKDDINTNVRSQLILVS